MLIQLREVYQAGLNHVKSQSEQSEQSKWTKNAPLRSTIPNGTQASSFVVGSILATSMLWPCERETWNSDFLVIWIRPHFN